MNSVASQSSNSGWMAIRPATPKSSVVFTMPVAEIHLPEAVHGHARRSADWRDRPATWRTRADYSARPRAAGAARRERRDPLSLRACRRRRGSADAFRCATGRSAITITVGKLRSSFSRSGGAPSRCSTARAFRGGRIFEKVPAQRKPLDVASIRLRFSRDAGTGSPSARAEISWSQHAFIDRTSPISPRKRVPGRATTHAERARSNCPPAFRTDGTACRAEP